MQDDQVVVRIIGLLRQFVGYPHYPSNRDRDEVLFGRAAMIYKFVHDKEMRVGELGLVNDLDWLIEKALMEFDHFPLPAELKELHSQYFPPKGDTNESEV